MPERSRQEVGPDAGSASSATTAGGRRRPAPDSGPSKGVARSALTRSLGLVVALGLLVVVALSSVVVGARDLSIAEVVDAVVAFDGSSAHAVVWESRLPRTLIALAVGPALGVCGALIQAFTRNPLADPGILGVNAGAAFAITLAIGFLGLRDPAGYLWFAFLGALVVTAAVYAIGSAGRGTATPAKLTLAGVAISAALGGIGTGIELKNRDVFQGVRMWGVGSIGGRDIEVLWTVGPFLLIGLALALVLARPLNAFALGDDLGTALGARIGTTRVLTVVAVTVLAGGATAIAGPIGFIGLMVPHIVRWFTGPDQRWIIPYSMIVAAILLLLSDMLARVILPSGELRVGLVTALVGAPVLIALARRRTARGL